MSQRSLRALILGRPSPISAAALQGIAERCSQQGAAADKVERRVRKSAAASLLSTHVGERFEGIVTGAGEGGHYARVFKPPVEGKIVRGGRSMDVGDKVHLRLIDVNVEKGYIDFEIVG